MTGASLPTTAPRPAASPGRLRRVRGPVLLAAAVLGASLVLHVRDPHQGGSYGLCPWLALTGTTCPGCGGLRAVSDLTHGQLLAAASSNLLLVVSLPAAAFAWARWFVDRWRGVRRRIDERHALLGAGAFLTVAVVFAVVRNLPAGSWLAP